MAEPGLPRLRVLASGSQGNCTVLASGTPGLERLTLIDAGLSPRRTRRLLAESGHRPDQIDDLVITHLDRDHFHQGWTLAALAPRARVRVHRRHAAYARRVGVPPGTLAEFDGPFALRDTADITPVRLAHDEHGVTAFRFDFNAADVRGSLGFATDLGRVTQELTDVFQGVGLLAIESNYDPSMQVASERPDFLKRRIMNGAGHLSNDEARDAVRAIAPTQAVVFLHLSRQCNTPELVASMHAGSGVPVVCAEQFEPTPWIAIEPAAAPATPPATTGQAQARLF
ncbi:MAG: MBL fold metallo-hydrolase [Planctomycetota bacterium]